MKEVSSLGMKVQPNSEAERDTCLHLYEVPPKPWLYRGCPSADTLLANGMLPFNTSFLSTFGDGEISHTVVATLCPGHHESCPDLDVYPVVPKALCSCVLLLLSKERGVEVRSPS